MSEERKKVLVIDDDPDFVSSTKLMLESGPYEAIDAPDGKTGFEKAKTEKESHLAFLNEHTGLCSAEGTFYVF